MSCIIERVNPLFAVKHVTPRTCCVQFIEYTTIGLRLSGHGAAEIDFNLMEELRHAETNPIQRETWMLCKNDAQTIIGMSMGQEICLILGQVSLSLLFLEETPPDGHMRSGERRD